MTDLPNRNAPLSAPGTRVAERLAYWRTRSWAQLVELMSVDHDDASPYPPSASTVEAPPVQIRLRS
ncbi:hypothetical protein GCM10022197_22060 [Microlunatus spumicola]|uniref:Uncharacterized protein n=1 Tax=Microlunatus spumicola TaxID=81499 RepID=A0ABP6XEA0_9ACTN